MTVARQTVIALFAGLAVGIAISMWGNPALTGVASLADVTGALWVNAIRMTVIPLVVSLLIVSIGSATGLGNVGRLASRTLLWFLALLGGSAIFAALLVPLIFAWLPVESLAAGSPGLPPMAVAESIAQDTAKLPSFSQWLLALVPSNPARAASDGAMLPLLVFTLLFALASTRIAPELRSHLMRFFQAVSETMLTLVRWIIMLAPIGVFALMLALGARMGATAVGVLGYGVAVLCTLLLLQMLAMYPLAAIFGGVNIRRFTQAALPVQAVAFSTRSSLATLPALIESADKRLGLPVTISGFVLPLAVSTFKISAPISWIVGALFIGQLYGVPLSTSQIAVIAAVSVILSFTSPGIPSGSLVLMAPLFASLGLPLEGIGILIAIDVFPDMFKTMSNVTADLSVAALVSRDNHAHMPIPPNGGAETGGAGT